MKRCKMFVQSTWDGTIIIWCDTCKETVGFDEQSRDQLSVEIVQGTVEGHHRVMDRARKAENAFRKGN